MANTYVPIYSQPDPGNGIAGFDLGSPNDLGFAFDFNSSGNLDHIVFFRPGTGMIRIIKKNPEDDNFSAVFQSDEGISNWDLLSTADRGFAFDFDHNGKADHLVFYRPGARQISIFKNHNGNFIPVFESQNGIGAYDLAGPSDQVFAFDYNHRGNLDYLVLYRPGFGFINIVENNTGNFTPIIATDHGIGGYDIRSPVDRIYALDLERNIWIQKNNGNNNFNAVYVQGNPGVSPGAGIGGFDLQSPNDTSFAYDYDGTGHLDHIVLYRRGSGMIWIIKHANSVPNETFAAVLSEGDPGEGIGGYDLRSPADLIFPFDAASTGKLQDLVLYRPGTGKISIVRKK